MATNTYIALDKVTVGTATPTITFTNIPQGYTDLVLVLSGTKTVASGEGIAVRVGNGSLDTGSNYSDTILYGNGSSAGSARTSSASRSRITYYASWISTAFSVNTIHFMNYSNTTTYKTMLSRSNTASQGVDANVHLWRSTSAIDTISVYPFADNFDIGTTASLYGISAEAISPAPKATGGAIYSDDTYYYHLFGASGTFTPSQSLTADVLVVAGGGGGGYYYGAGGGAGGLLEYASQSLSATGYTITVGAGGATRSTNGVGNNGSNSQFGALTASVGGGGGGGGTSGTPTNGASGGSGGGGSQGGSGGAATSGQGYAGGTDAHSAGGGGAGQAGQARQGGNGATSTLINAIGSATGAGDYIFATSNYYFAGGGGASSSVLPASYGGGGVANGTTAQRYAKVNSGSGGVGDAQGAGGSGVVVVRYSKA